ncbi:hypothetical protein [Kosakonia oryzae]|uniref:hypothetical protein n=1 Tax=Kosakonia oryzae TaxID=497725 RepID=UPI001FCA05EA|nr:hypothetical protein [Kosakonia oryzae]
MGRFIKNVIDIIHRVYGTFKALRPGGVPELHIKNKNAGNKKKHSRDERDKGIAHYRVLGEMGDFSCQNVSTKSMVERNENRQRTARLVMVNFTPLFSDNVTTSQFALTAGE